MESGLEQRGIHEGCIISQSEGERAAEKKKGKGERETETQEGEREGERMTIVMGGLGAGSVPASAEKPGFDNWVLQTKGCHQIFQQRTELEFCLVLLHVNLGRSTTQRD